MHWRIHRLNTGYLEAVPLHFFVASGAHPDVPGGRLSAYGVDGPIAGVDRRTERGVMIPSPVWYVEGGGVRIVVDTGLPPAPEMRTIMDRYASLGSADPIIEPEHDVATQLGALGVSPDDIDLVVLTHLHFDHIGGTELFRNATFLVNESELAWALAPKPYGLYYYPECREHVLNVLDRIEPVQRDRQVAPGVRMVWTGGHTTGHSVVFVDTAVGSVVLGGDTVNTYRCLEYGWPPGNQIDLVGTLHAMDVLRTADVIVVHHSLLLEELFPENVIGDAPLSDRAAAYMAKLRTAGAFPLAQYGSRS